MIEIYLAQAETLKRLGRHDDVTNKLSVARATSLDFHKTQLNPALDMLLAAKISIASGQLDFAAELLSHARILKGDERTMHNIAVELDRLGRERVIAGGSIEEMVKQLFMYTCINCGALVEYISIPCVECGWRPKTLIDACQAVRLCSVNWSITEMLGIGREIKAGRTIADIVPNLGAHVAEYVANPKSEVRGLAVSVLRTAEDKKYDDCFAWRDAATCQSCGSNSHRPDANDCEGCNNSLRLSPPLRLMLCLNRLFAHIQHNVELHDPVSSTADGRAEQPSLEVESFVTFLCSLRSRLYRAQETPSNRERLMVLTFMTNIKRLRLNEGLGTVEFADPANVAGHLRSSLSANETARAEPVLADVRGTFQFLATWMSKSKALC